MNGAAAPLETTIELANGFGSGAFYQDPDCGLVHDLSTLAGTEPDTADYGTNALRYGEVADQIVVFGPGSIDQAHQAVEWVDIAQIELAADVYRHWFNA